MPDFCSIYQTSQRNCSIYNVWLVFCSIYLTSQRTCYIYNIWPSSVLFIEPANDFCVIHDLLNYE